jgi:hypothetical protein
LAKILVPEGSKDVPVGQAIAITVNCNIKFDIEETNLSVKEITSLSVHFPVHFFLFFLFLLVLDYAS